MNNSKKDLSVFGILDNGVRLDTIEITSGKLRYLSLYRNGYCHKYMQLYLAVLHGEALYNQKVFPGDDVSINNPLKL